MNVFLKRTEHLLQKSLDCNLFRCNFRLVFHVKFDKVVFERITLITAVSGKPLYLPLQQRLLLAENSFVFASLWETLASVSKQTKSMLQNCYEKMLKF